MQPDLKMEWFDCFRLCKCLRHIGKVMLLVLLGLAGGIYWSTVSNALLPALRAAAPLGRLFWGLALLLYTGLVGPRPAACCSAARLPSPAPCTYPLPPLTGRHPPEQVGMLLWSYFATFLTDPGRVPPGWHPFPSDEEAQQEAAALAEERGNPLAPWRSGGGAGSWQQYQEQYQKQHADPSAGRAFLERPRFCKKCKVRAL